MWMTSSACLGSKPHTGPPLRSKPSSFLSSSDIHAGMSPSLCEYPSHSSQALTPCPRSPSYSNAPFILLRFGHAALVHIISLSWSLTFSPMWPPSLLCSGSIIPCHPPFYCCCCHQALILCTGHPHLPGVDNLTLITLSHPTL